MTDSGNNSIYLGSQRLAKVEFSPVRKVLERAKEIEKQGHEMVYFQIGEPDFNTPAEIKRATIEAINNNMTHYAPNRGVLSLRQAICTQLKDLGGLEYDAEKEIIVTAGGAEAINVTLLSLINPDDEVIIFTPAFMNYKNVINMAGGKVIAIPLKKENGFQIDIDDVKAKITSRTKMVIINNPCNPTGIVFKEEILQELAQIVVENNLVAVSDEMYDQIVYDDEKCTSIAIFPGMKERTVIVNGFSKAYAMTGWRLGYVASDPRLITNILKVHQYETTCLPTFIQVGVAEGMLRESSLNAIEKMVGVFAKRRKLLLKGLEAIGKLSFIEPKGAFYVFVNVSATGQNGIEFASRLLEEKYVAVVPGAGFGEEAADYIRISFATAETQITEGLKRIREYVNEI